jgi:hypothetical protein
MTLQNMILMTGGVWLLIVIGIGFWRLIYKWHWGNGVIFFSHSLPLLVLGLIVIMVLEIIVFRFRPRS